MLVLVGGAIGGACGGAAWVLNQWVFRKVDHPVLRYVCTGMISAAAIVGYFVLAGVVYLVLHKQG